MHGIEAGEIAQGPAFGVAWARFVSFVEGLQRLSLPEPSDSEGEDGPVVVPQDVPTVILAAHNGFRFDFAMLLFECARHGCSWTPLEEWLFVDSLLIVQTVVAKLGAALNCNASCAGILRKGCRHIVPWTIA